jgi:hypothetical protein
MMLTITPDTYKALRHHQDIADRVMAEIHYSPNDVTEIRVSEGHTEIDWMWRDRRGKVQLNAAGDGVDIRTTVITARGTTDPQ